jgi:hypothetical protein
MPWLRHFALFLVFVAALFRPAAAGAFVSAPDAGSQARVGAFELVAATLVGPASAATCGLHEGIGAAYDENASGYRFAAGGAGRTWCFPAGTKVHTPDGLVDIEDVEAGDEVLAYDEETGEVVVRRVESTSTSWTERLVDVELSRETLASTGGHPYWEETTRGWLRADKLYPGMIVRLRDGRMEEVLGVSERGGLVEVHNFEVAGEHNYFVGESGVLVHNGGPEGLADFNQARNAALEWLEARGFKAEKQVISRITADPMHGKPIGMSTADGKVGFRVEFDAKNGAHINVWSGKEKGPHFQFKGDQSTVNRIRRAFGC